MEKAVPAIAIGTSCLRQPDSLSALQPDGITGHRMDKFQFHRAQLLMGQIKLFR